MKFAGVVGVVALLCALVPGLEASAAKPPTPGRKTGSPSAPQGTAFSETTPELDVVAYSTALNHVAETEVDFYFPVTTPAPAKISLSIPAGYAIQPAPAGTTIATVDAEAQINLQTKAFKGTLVVDDPARYASSTCASGPHAAAWAMFLPVEGQSYVIPLFVDGSPERGYTIQMCLQSPDVPAAGGGAPSAARLTYVALDFENTFKNPARADFHLWSALVTPFAGGTATADPAAVYELRSIVPLPEQLTIKARYDTKAKNFVISGKLVTVGRPESGTEIDVYGTPTIDGRFKKIGAATTDKQGGYSLRKRLASSMWLTPYVGIYIGKCDTGIPSPAPTGCTLQSYSPVFGNIVHATVPKPQKSKAKGSATTKKRR